MEPGRPNARWLFPPGLVALVALGFSLALHVPAYVGLGLLKHLLETEPPAYDAPMEVELIPGPTEPRDSEEEPEPIDDLEPLDEEDEEEQIVRRDRPEEPEEQPDEPPESEPEEEEDPEIAAAPPTPVAPPEERREISVQARSQDPTVEAPDNAQYLAEENNRVEEETIARIRNPNLDDLEPDPGAPTEESAEQEEGNADEQEVAELQEAEGSDARDPTPEEVRDPPPPNPPRPPSTSRQPAVAEAARGGGRQGGSPAPQAPRTSASGGRQARGGGRQAMREVIVTDGTGSFSVWVPVEPEGSGEGEGGGPAVAERGRGSEGEGRGSGRAGRGRERARGGAASGRGAPNLRLSWSDFASVYGEEELERQREAYLEQRRSRQRGVSRAERWRRFRAAMENYNVRARPGTHTALNTRADPFAAYINAMHNRIHPRFAMGFLTRVPSTVEAAYRSNQNMHTKLEIAVDDQGRVEIGIVRTSGDILFDLGAFEAVMGAAPFPAPPANIRSPDGKVYVHWSFYRNQRQCGQFNAQPYILAEAPGQRRRDTLIDRGPVPPGRVEEE